MAASCRKIVCVDLERWPDHRQARKAARSDRLERPGED